MNNNIDPMCAEWLDAKRQEREAIDKRRSLEDQLVKALGINDAEEGVQSAETESYQIKVTARLTRKVDADRVQEIAAENGTSELLSSLFRWKPEINMAVWKATKSELTEPLLDAIETKPGRPSFTIKAKESE